MLITSSPSPGATDKLGCGFISYQKCFAIICMLVYGVADDLIDEYLRMSETTMYKFCKAVIVVFGIVYIREPNVLLDYCRSMRKEGFLDDRKY
jgi:hypothetical protein